MGKQRPPRAALALASTDVLWDLAALLSPWAMGAPGWPLHQLQRGKLSWKAHPRKATKRGIGALNKHPTFSRAGIWLSMQAIVVAWHVNVPCSLSRTVPGWVSPGRWPRSPTSTGAHRGALKPSPCCHNPPAVGHTGGAGGLQPLEAHTWRVGTRSILPPGGHRPQVGGTLAPGGVGVMLWKGGPLPALHHLPGSLTSATPCCLLLLCGGSSMVPPKPSPAAPSPIKGPGSGCVGSRASGTADGGCKARLPQVCLPWPGLKPVQLELQKTYIKKEGEKIILSPALGPWAWPGFLGRPSAGDAGSAGSRPGREGCLWILKRSRKEE